MITVRLLLYTYKPCQVLRTMESRTELKAEVGPERVADCGDGGAQVKCWNDIIRLLPPLEVRDRIFNRLDLEDKVSARSVSKLWKGFVDETIELCPLLFDGSWQEVLKLGSYGDHIRKLTISKLKTFKYPKKGLGFASIKEVNIVPCQEHCRVSGMSEENLKKFLGEYAADIETLYLNSSALNSIKCPSILQTAKFDCLQKLEMSTYNIDKQGFITSADILRNILPSLTSVDIRVLNREDNLLQIPLFYEECYRFLANHATTLDDISLTHSNEYDERNIDAIMLDLIDHTIRQDTYLDLLEKIDNIKVSSLCLKLTFYEGRSRFQFGIRLLQAQTHLTSLKICNLSYANTEVWNAVRPILTKCSKTLKSVIFNGCFCHEGPDDMDFSCSLVKYCSQLTTLNIKICGPAVVDIEDLPKQIKVLCLGQKLSQDQIDFICKNMTSLEEINLPQGDSLKPDSTVPRVTVKVFNQLLTIKTLARLSLNRKTCSLKKIRRIVNKTSGFKEVFDDDGTEEMMNPDLVKFRFDLDTISNISAIMSSLNLQTTL